MEQPLVSILINNYNYGQFLAEAIESALNQTYANIEVLVVDDGSTDSSAEVMAGYAGRIIPILKKNGGQASALNLGVARARGDIICFLDADDAWMPDKVEQVVRAFRQHPRAGLVYHRVQPVDAALKPQGEAWPQSLYTGSIAALVQRTGGWWHQANTSSLAFRRSTLERIGPVPDSFVYSADAYLGELAALLVEVVGLPQQLTLYRVHGTNVWYAGGANSQKRIALYRNCIGAINARLAQLGVPGRLEERQHFQLQLHRFLNGEAVSIPGLLVQALTFPGEPKLKVRLRSAASILARVLRLHPRARTQSS
ncbi:glycosyltransferase family 2 protein [Deinococcus sonorensis]|uniref:Glycosyltransferase n=2 Tax=Deinococcus sonorensis TaxID=309891 RepID=A0AAU7U975_9DEIO